MDNLEYYLLAELGRVPLYSQGFPEGIILRHCSACRSGRIC